MWKWRWPDGVCARYRHFGGFAFCIYQAVSITLYDYQKLGDDRGLFEQVRRINRVSVDVFQGSMTRPGLNTGMLWDTNVREECYSRPTGRTTGPKGYGEWLAVLGCYR